MRTILGTLLLFFCTQSIAQPAAPCNLKVGINLAGPTDYNAEWPFVDIMRYCRAWETTNAAWTAGGQNLWNTELIDHFGFDEQGYPLEVPLDIDHPNADTEQVIRTVWANTSALPAGTYVLLYEGEGEIAFRFDAQAVSQSPGRIEVAVTPNDDIMALMIMRSNPDNPIRNIRFLMPGTEASYQDNPWSADFLEKVAPFKALRFMDWGLTNNSRLQSWSGRPLPTDYTYTIDGNPYEYWIDLCNRNRSDAWVCVPHQADDNYIEQLATLFRDGLDPGLKVYVEYSNELWNWIFDQAHYGNDELNQGLPWPERLGPRIADVMQIWTDVFGAGNPRLVRVMGGQHAWLDIGTRIYAQIEAEGLGHLIDAISPAGYMSYDPETIASLGAAATGQDVVSSARVFTFDENEYAMEGWRGHAALAAGNSKQLVFYEGGQHFTPHPWGTVQPYNLALLEAQAIPEMHGLYLELLDTLSRLSEEEMLFMHFSFISPLGDTPEEARWGSFGALPHQFGIQPPYTIDDAPKYRALLDHIGACDNITSTEAAPPAGRISVSPNPSGGLVRLECTGGTPEKVALFSLAGRLLMQAAWPDSWRDHPDREPAARPESGWLDLSGLPSGTYFLKVTGGERQWVEKVVLARH